MCSLHAKYKQFFFTVSRCAKGSKGRLRVAGEKVCLTIDFCLKCIFVYMSMYVWRTAHRQPN